MADSIVQNFVIDAAQALRTLELLDQGFKSLESRLESVAHVMRGMNKTTKSVDNLGAAFSRTMPDAAKQTDKLTASTERFTVSAGLMARIITTQLVVRALSQLRNALTDTAERAVEFQQSIALSQTIDDSGQSFNQLAASARAVSDEFNIDLIETTRGLYQTLSNQVGDTAESFDFLREAAQFAKATNSSLADSVDLLSGVLKSFNLDAKDTDRAAGILFTAIDKGRLTADALANAMGRVAPTAEAAGLSLEETAAAVAAVSQKGSNAAESLTQLRGIVSSFLKPTPALTKALADLGFTSSEVALRTLGFSETLRRVTDSAGGSNEVLAKMFPNVRALNGVLALTGDELKTVAGIIDETTNAARSFSKEKFLVATATDAERVTAELNRLRNEMTFSLGQATLSVTDDLFKLTGGAEGLISVGKTAIPVIGGLATAMLAFKAATAAQNAELGLLSGSLKSLGVLAIGAGVGATIGSAIEERLSTLNLKALNTLKDQDKQYLADFEASQKKQRDEFNRTIEARVKSASLGMAEINKQYQIDVSNARNAFEQKAAFEKAKARSPVNEDLLSNILGRELNTPDEVSRGLFDAGQKAVDLKSQIDDAVAGEEGIKVLRDNMTQVFSDLDRLSTSRAGALGQAGEQLRDQFKAAFAELQNLRLDDSITRDELVKFIELRNELGKAVFNQGDFLSTATAKVAFRSTLEQLDGAQKALVEIQRLQASIPSDVGLLQGELEALNLVLKQASPELGFQAATNALSAGVQPAQQIASAMESAATAAERAAAAAARIQPIGRANGGRIDFRAFGGRGLDTVMAALTPGEYVINPKSTQRYFSQLQAMNAGQTPVFRDNGGTVNNTVGDINLNVKGGDSSEQTVRKIASGLKREFRRRGSIL